MFPRGPVLALASALVVFGQGLAVHAQDLMIYPAQGQSEERQNKDRYECHNWAVGQTGYDPTNPPKTQGEYIPPPESEATEGGVLRGGARGAALGAVGGAIAGNAGKGAAIGAATGALFGGMRRSDQRRRQDQQQQNYERQVQQQQAQQQQAQADSRQRYNRAMTACLEARGYSVS